MSKVDKSGAWEQVRLLRSMLESSDDKAITYLRDSWQLLVKEKMTLGRDHELEGLSFSPATYIVRSVEMGCYPPPEMMLWLAGQIEEYVEAGGKKDLEVLFFGEKVKGRQGGNYAARERAVVDRLNLIMKLGAIRKKSPGISLRAAIEIVFDVKDEVLGEEIDIDVKLKTLRDHGYSHELFTHPDPDCWYFEIGEDHR